MLTRTLRLGTVGVDVEAWARGAHRYLQDGQLAAFSEQRSVVKRTFGLGKITLAKNCAAKAGLPQYGVVGPALDTAMRKAGAYDLVSDALFTQYAESVAPKPLPLIEPWQGFASLHPKLHEAYSICRRLGLGDAPGLASGTHNGTSTLPGGGKSDHAFWPSYAFDLDIGPNTGWSNTAARNAFLAMVGRPEIAYVILGDRIASAERAWEIRTYTSGGHMNHIHVSAVH